MGTHFHLIFHNVLLIVSAILAFGMAIFTYLNGRRQAANIAFSGVMFMATLYTISDAIGVNVSDPYLSRFFLMFNLCIFIAGAFQVHAALAMAKLDKEKKWIIILLYASSLACIIFFIFEPNLFLLPSVPKMYFPNYYNPGILNWTRVAFLVCICESYTFYIFAKAAQDAKTPIERKQFVYFLISAMVSYNIIFIPNFLVYNIQIDPLWGMLWSPVFIVPFLYLSIRYELFNVKIIAKQAFLYSLAVAVVGGLITLFNYSNVWIREAFPTFPLWITAFISSVLAVTVSLLIWRKFRETDVLKYEFITAVTHKFRTPLTHIKWAAENLTKGMRTEDERTQLAYIQNADSRLVQLTNVLVNVSEAGESSYDYHLEKNDLAAIAAEAISTLRDQFEAKQIELVKKINPNTWASVDAPRIRFVIQTFLENAIHYTPDHAQITISLASSKDIVTCTVSDSGIGIPKEELPLLFSRFYRGRQAKLADTEGMGIGLYISKEIISRHNGHIWAESEGSSKGSTFSFSVPVGPGKTSNKSVT